MKNFKTFILMGVMTFIMLLIGNLIGGRQGIYFALILAGFTNFISYWYSDKIVLKMYNAKPVSVNSDLYKLVQGLVKKADLPMPKVYMIHSNQPNAFATGRNPQNAAVAVTSGLMEILDDNELSGVIGHELGHVNNRDILIGTVAATFAGAISFLANMARWGAIFGGSRDDEDRGGNPLYLANALEKLEIGVARNPMNASPATENMFIISPLSSRDKMATLFSTHPSTKDRIARLYEIANR